MRTRLRSLIGALSAAALCLFPPVAIVPYARPRRGKPSDLVSWLLAGFVLLPATLVAFTHAPSAGVVLLGQAILIVIVGTMARIGSPRTFGFGILMGLAILAGATLFVRELSRAQWIAHPDQPNIAHLVQGVSRIDGAGAGWRHAGVRRIAKAWSVDEGIDRAWLSFDARQVDGTSGLWWYVRGRNARQEVVESEYATVVGGEGVAAVRRQRTEAPLGARTIRASIELRAPRPFQMEACDGLRLRTLAPLDGTCADLDVGKDWRAVSIQHRFSEDVTRTAFNVVVGVPDHRSIDIRSVRIEELVDGDWLMMDASAPSGLTVQVAGPGHEFDRPAFTVAPSEAWETFAFEFPVDPAASDGALELEMDVDGGAAFEVRRIVLRVPDGPAERSATPRPELTRARLWLGAPNLLGHAVMATVLLALLVVRDRRVAWVAYVLGLFIVALSGSRIAIAGLTLGGIGLLWNGSRRRFGAILLGAGIFASLALGSIATDVPGIARLVAGAEGGNSVPRVEIWNVALGIFGEHPWTGAGVAAVPREWVARELQGPVPAHAHSFVLEYAAAYGVAGLLSALAVQAAFLALAIRTFRWRGAVAIAPILVSQLVDVTLFSAGVLIPLLVVLGGSSPPSPVRGLRS